MAELRPPPREVVLRATERLRQASPGVGLLFFCLRGRTAEISRHIVSLGVRVLSHPPRCRPLPAPVLVLAGVLISSFVAFITAAVSAPVTAPAPAQAAPSPVARPLSGASDSRLAGYRALRWDAQKQGGCVTSMCMDLQGRVYFGVEDSGIYRYDAIAGWTHFTIKDGIGDNNAYALACDRLGRIWAGSLNHGVSVYNGRWQNYDVLTGPLGPRIFAIATCPTDGDVWISSDAGLARYRLKENTWSYFTRAEGLPSDQANAIAFDRDGNIFVGTQCDGIAIARAAEKYAKWTAVTGPDRMPNTSCGSGLPTNLIDCLLITRKTGTVYAGTTTGLAKSSDDGKTWSYVRGADWSARVLGLYKGPQPAGAPNAPPPLLEDYVTALAEDNDGHLWVGHRQKGVEVLDPATGKVLTMFQDDFVDAILPISGRECLFGRYGDGVGRGELPAGVGTVGAGEAGGVSERVGPLTSAPPPVSAAALPTTEQLRSMMDRTLTWDTRARDGRYDGDDWTTQGDWCGRYGEQYARLCAMNAAQDQIVRSNPACVAIGRTGPHNTPGNSLRHWITWRNTDDVRALYSPVSGCRRQAEWDDAGETVPFTFEGPDIWVAVTVPQGGYRVSFYFTNKDGHVGSNRYRDYVLDCRRYVESMDLALAQPVIARVRVEEFWGGVYKQFEMAGPAKYWFRIEKNGSLNSICSGIFIDRLWGAPGKDERPSVWFGGTKYEAQNPDFDDATPATPTTETARAEAARLLWWATDDNAAMSQSPDSQQHEARILAYRVLATQGGPGPILANWRWNLCIWMPQDRADFRAAMLAARKALLKANPRLATVSN